MVSDNKHFSGWVVGQGEEDKEKPLFSFFLPQEVLKSRYWNREVT